VDECWNIHDIIYRESANHVKSVFLITLAKVLSDYQNFWDDTKLVIAKSYRQKLALLNLNEPSIHTYITSSSANRSHELLYDKLVKWINSGRSTYRLTPITKILDDATVPAQTESEKD
jgi:hypothetical protein